MRTLLAQRAHGVAGSQGALCLIRQESAAEYSEAASALPLSCTVVAPHYRPQDPLLYPLAPSPRVREARPGAQCGEWLRA